MEGGELARRQKKIDAGGGGPVALEEQGQRTLADDQVAAVDLPKSTPFHMRDQLKLFYPVRSWAHRSVFDGYLRGIHVRYRILDLGGVAWRGRYREIEF